MNRPLRKVAIAVLVMFAALLVNSNILQVGEASSLKSNPHNSRTIYDEYANRRGPIVAGGRDVARSVSTHDALKYLRTYPGGAAYAPITGFFSLVYGSTAVEHAEDPVLAGTSDTLGLSRLRDEITGRTPQGGSVVLTINDRAQQAAYNALSHAGHPGAAVALDPRTGAILALASTPSYDPSTMSSHNGRSDRQAYQQLLHDPGNPLLDRALNQTYPPGSTFKVVTTATALSTGKYTPQSTLPAPPALPLPQTTHKLTNFAGETCGSGGTITLTQALTISCNTAYGALGLRLGAPAIQAQAKKFGFDSSVSVPMASSPSHFAATATGPNVAYAAIGQYSDSVTPIQMAMVAAAIANHGELMSPYLVGSTRGTDASVLTRTPTHSLGQAVTPSVATQLTTMMQSVVDHGTGTSARIPGVPVAGKTGTAETATGQAPDSWFISFAPAQAPKVAVAVLVEHGGQGAVAAAPIARTVMCAVLGCS